MIRATTSNTWTGARTFITDTEAIKYDREFKMPVCVRAPNSIATRRNLQKYVDLVYIN